MLLLLTVSQFLEREIIEGFEIDDKFDDHSSTRSIIASNAPRDLFICIGGSGEKLLRLRLLFRVCKGRIAVVS